MADNVTLPGGATPDQETLMAWSGFVSQTGGTVAPWPFVDDAHAGELAGLWPLAAWRVAAQQGNLPVRGDGVRLAPDGNGIYITALAVANSTIDPSMRADAPFSPVGGIVTLLLVAGGLLWLVLGQGRE